MPCSLANPTLHPSLCYLQQTAVHLCSSRRHTNPLTVCHSCRPAGTTAACSATPSQPASNTNFAPDNIWSTALQVHALQPALRPLPEFAVHGDRVKDSAPDEPRSHPVPVPPATVERVSQPQRRQLRPARPGRPPAVQPRSGSAAGRHPAGQLAWACGCSTADTFFAQHSRLFAGVRPSPRPLVPPRCTRRWFTVSASTLFPACMSALAAQSQGVLACRCSALTRLDAAFLGRGAGSCSQSKRCSLPF